MIREFKITDNEQIMNIWLKGNIDAHPFISKNYWYSNFAVVQEQILKANIFVYEDDDEIQGFVGIVNSYIAGVFVDEKYRSKGIGKQLIEYVKQKYHELSLNVYHKNRRATAFYLREGFSIHSENIDKITDEKEYTMIWRRN